MDDASNDDNDSSLAPDTCGDRSLPSEPAPQVIFVSGEWARCSASCAAPRLEATRPRARDRRLSWLRAALPGGAILEALQGDDLDRRPATTPGRGSGAVARRCERETRGGVRQGTVIGLHNPQDAESAHGCAAAGCRRFLPPTSSTPSRACNFRTGGPDPAP